MERRAKILVIDNFDSFVFTIAQYLEELGAHATVLSSNELNPSDVSRFDGVLISPGPGSPLDAHTSIAALAHCVDSHIPVLGVCLGHQIIAHYFGAQIVNAPELIHGKTSLINHSASGVFKNLPNPFVATRYHSLIVERSSITGNLKIDAETATGDVMGISHSDKKIYGVQFHPESVLTEHGHQLFQNWLNLI